MDDLPRFIGHGVWLPAHNALEGGHRRRQLVVQPAQHGGHGLQQVRPVVDVAVNLIGLDRLGLLGQIVPADLVAAVQGGGHRLDLQIILIALVGLQGGDELLHLADSLLVVDGEEHAGLDINQVGGHGHKVAGHLQVQLLPPVHPLHVLVQDEGDLDVLNLQLVFAQQVEDQVQRTHKVLHMLLLCLHHPFQVVNGCLQGPTSPF